MAEVLTLVEIVGCFIRNYVAGHAEVHFDGRSSAIRIVDEESQYYKEAIILFALDPTGDHFSAGFLIAGGWENSPSLHDPNFDLLPWVSQQLSRLILLPPPGFSEEAWLDGTWPGVEEGDDGPPTPT